MLVQTLESVISLMATCDKKNPMFAGVKVHQSAEHSILAAGSHFFINTIETHRDDSLGNAFIPYSALDHLKALLKEYKGCLEFESEEVLRYCNDVEDSFPDLSTIDGLMSQTETEDFVLVDMDLIIKAAKAIEHCHADKKKRKQMVLNNKGKNQFLLLESQNGKGKSLIAPARVLD